MKIERIFAESLFVFKYGEMNEYDRLMDLWTDANFLQVYAKRNNVSNVYGFIEEILVCAEEIQDFLNQIDKENDLFELYFQPLQSSEFGKELAFQKGKVQKNRLRLYAIKIDANCFVITGGAIKMSQQMKDHPDTSTELEKLKKARTYLNQNGVFDEDSFFELLSEII